MHVSLQLGRSRAVGSWIMLLFLAAWILTTTTNSAVGQAGKKKAGDAGKKAAAPPANGGGGGGGGEATGGDSGEEAKPPKKLLEWVWGSLGLGYFLIFLMLSFTLVALFVMNLLTSRRENVCPTFLVDGFQEHLDGKRYQEAYELAKGDESFLGQVLSAGLAKMSAGYQPAVDAMQEVGEEENMKLEHRLSYMALIGSISPMVGLFGTVHGMIKSFSAIELGGASPNPSELAGGISTALFTTLVGLAIAIPAIVAFNILRNRIARLVLEVGVLSENLMARFENVGPQQQQQKKTT